MTAGRDRLVGEIAVDRGYLTQEELDEAREAHRAVRAMGVDEPLIEILVGKHLITPDQAQDLVHAAAVETGEARLVAGYEGYLVPNATGPRVFHVSGDDHVRLMMGEQLIVAVTHKGGFRASGKVGLQNGKPYRLRRGRAASRSRGGVTRRATRSGPRSPGRARRAGAGIPGRR